MFLCCPLIRDITLHNIKSNAKYNTQSPLHTPPPPHSKKKENVFFTSLEASRERLIQRSRSADCVYEDEKKKSSRLFAKENIKELLTSIKTSGGFELTIHMQTSN